MLTAALPWTATSWTVRGTRGDDYTVAMDRRGGLACDCADGLRHRATMWCKGPHLSPPSILRQLSTTHAPHLRLHFPHSF